MQTFRYAFPFEGNWNAALTMASLDAGARSDTLSRLKGIETYGHDISTELGVKEFRYAFPFEGNWNLHYPDKSPSHFRFRYAFPFEGNWNIFCHTVWNNFSNWVQIRFPVWRELKLCKDSFVVLLQFCSDTLSRLKGIETHIHTICTLCLA